MEVIASTHSVVDAVILDLRHVYGGIPGGEEGGRADAAANLRRLHMHGIGELCPVVGVGVIAQIWLAVPQLRAEFLQQHLAWGLKRTFSGPDRADDFHAGVLDFS